jgi:hypothetical protein
MCQAPVQLLEAEIISINLVPTYSLDEIRTRSRTTGIVLLKMLFPIRLSTSGLSAVYGSVSELGAAALYDCNPDRGCSDKPWIIV